MFDKDTREVLFGIALSLFVTIWFIASLAKGNFVLAFSLPVVLEIIRVIKDRRYWNKRLKNQ